MLELSILKATLCVGEFYEVEVFLNNCIIIY